MGTQKEVFMQESESIKRDLRFSRIKTLIVLFASSLLVFLWGRLFLEMTAGMGIPFAFRTLLPVPLFLNAGSWLLWLMLGYLQTGGSYSRHRDYEREFDERMLYDQYQLTQYTLRRSKQIERFVDMMTALQFASMALMLAYQFYYVR
jgi:hypothetical protein